MNMDMSVSAVGSVIINFNFQASLELNRFYRRNNDLKLDHILGFIDGYIGKKKTLNSEKKIEAVIPEDWQHGPLRETEKRNALSEGQYKRFQSRLVKISKKYHCKIAHSTSYLHEVTTDQEHIHLLEKYKNAETLNEKANNKVAFCTAQQEVVEAKLPFTVVRTVGSIIDDGLITHDHIKLTPFIEPTARAKWVIDNHKLTDVLFDIGELACFNSDEIVLICREFPLLQFLPSIKSVFALSNTNDPYIQGKSIERLVYNDTIRGCITFFKGPPSVVYDAKMTFNQQHPFYVSSKVARFDDFPMRDETPHVLKQTHNYPINEFHQASLTSLWLHAFDLCKAFPRHILSRDDLVRFTVTFKDLITIFLKPYIDLSLSQDERLRTNIFSDELFFNIIPFFETKLDIAYDAVKGKPFESKTLFQDMAVNLLDAIEVLELTNKLGIPGFKILNFEAQYKLIRNNWYDFFNDARDSNKLTSKKRRREEDGSGAELLIESLKHALGKAFTTKMINQAWNEQYLAQLSYLACENTFTMFCNTLTCLEMIARRYEYISDIRSSINTYLCLGGILNSINCQLRTFNRDDFSDKTLFSKEQVDEFAQFLPRAYEQFQTILRLLKKSKANKFKLEIENKDNTTTCHTLNKIELIEEIQRRVDSLKCLDEKHSALYAQAISLEQVAIARVAIARRERSANNSVPLRYYAAIRALEIAELCNHSSQMGLIYAFAMIEKIASSDTPAMPLVLEYFKEHLSQTISSLCKQTTKPARATIAKRLIREIAVHSRTILSNPKHRAAIFPEIGATYRSKEMRPLKAIAGQDHKPATTFTLGMIDTTTAPKPCAGAGKAQPREINADIAPL